MPPLRLLYVADPLCSWCWGFQPVLDRFVEQTPGANQVDLILGGLAEDSGVPMGPEMRSFVQGAWRAVEQRCQVPMNWQLWQQQSPKRSTWPACRAVLAAKQLAPGGDWRLYRSLQKAFYQQAKDVTDEAQLLQSATESATASDPPLDPIAFEKLWRAEETQHQLHAHRQTVESLGVQGFPALFLVRRGETLPLAHGYRPLEVVQKAYRESQKRLAAGD
ncbi:MAG: DsbA family protein [Planctomycetota bacterium]|nr:MAG: DsbA family protein [Planctomycetota bacterium]